MARPVQPKSGDAYRLPHPLKAKREGDVLNNSPWISVKDQLPPEGVYVLCRHTRGTWHDSTDNTGVNCVVLKLVKGITESDRQQMRDGLIEDPIVKFDGGSTSKRSSIYQRGDVHGNNLVPYEWQRFGPDSFFGQDIDVWQPIETPPALERPPLTSQQEKAGQALDIAMKKFDDDCSRCSRELSKGYEDAIKNDPELNRAIHELGEAFKRIDPRDLL